MGNTHEHHGLCEGGTSTWTSERSGGSALEVGFDFVRPLGKKTDDTICGDRGFASANICIRTGGPHKSRSCRDRLKLLYRLGTLFGHFTRHLHHEHIDELLVLVQRHLQLPLELLANVMRRERRQIAMGDHIESQPME